MLVKEVFKLEMLVGNCSALNTESSLMGKCHLIKQLVVVMMHSIPSSQRLVLGNMFQELFSLILSQQLLMKLGLEHTDNFSILNNLFQERKMLLITIVGGTMLLVNKLLIFALIGSENLLINVLVSKDF